jgi:hypothetical protein
MCNYSMAVVAPNRVLWERTIMTQALRKWAASKGIRPCDFNKVTGYSYNHAYQVLCGDLNASSQTLGKVLTTYGEDALREITALMDELSRESKPEREMIQ